MITPRPPCHSIVLWTHRQEWGSVSNTGSILPLILEKTRLLMKGLPEHEEEWKNLLLDHDVLSSLQSSLVLPWDASRCERVKTLPMQALLFPSSKN